MGCIYLLNDVNTELDGDNVIVGQSNELASRTGEEQSILIGTNIQKHLGKISAIYASSSPRLLKLLHCIRSKSDKGHLASVPVMKKDALLERNFGVLTGSRHSVDSDLFSHTRISAEKGESVAQTRDRAISFINHSYSPNKNYLFVSHPFWCQIASNVLLGKTHTVLTKFWFQKGSMIKIIGKQGKFGLLWSFENAYNAIEDKVYTLDEIYNDLAV